MQPVMYPKGEEPVVAKVVYEYGVAQGCTALKLSFKPAGKNQPRAELKFPANGQSLWGETSIARYVARVLLGGRLSGGACELARAQVDAWLDECTLLEATQGSPQMVQRFVSLLEESLATKTYLVGYRLSVADIAVRLWLERVNGGQQPARNTQRWATLIDNEKEVAAALQQMKAQKQPVASSSRKTAKGKGKEAADGSVKVKLMNLHGAEVGKVVTRFPPEPSGYMHLGHCKASLLNYLYATNYKGKMVLRFDDTNPAKAKQKFEDAICKDIATLEIKPWKVTHTSDHFDRLMAECKRMIAEGDLYVDPTPNEEIKRQRRARESSAFRDTSPEENLARWEEMVKGTPEGQKCVVRAKMDPQSDVGCLRDPNMYRCATEKHYITGDKYKVYPLYDFACPMIDSWEGVTHALRSNEYHDRDYLYNWILEKAKCRKVLIHDFGRLSFSYTLLSKRKLQWFVENGLVDDWDHPAFPTVRGMLRRGLTLDALRFYIRQQGSSKNIVLNDIYRLWAENRKLIDPISPRYAAVASANAVRVHVSNAPAARFAETRPRHKKEPSLGEKVVLFADHIWIEGDDARAIAKDEIVTLMDWGNAKVTDIAGKKAEDKETIPQSLTVELQLENTNFRGTKKLNWVADLPDTIPAKLVQYDNLINKPKLSKGKPDKGIPADKFEDFANKHLEYNSDALVDPSLRTLSKGTILQIERRGFFIVDKAYPADGDAASSTDSSAPLITLIQIPDGKHTAMSTLSSKLGPRAAVQPRNKK